MRNDVMIRFGTEAEKQTLLAAVCQIRVKKICPKSCSANFATNAADLKSVYHPF